MPVVYECKNCGQLSWLGLSNEFGELFCNESCYKQYCNEHGYEIHLDKLTRID